MNTILILKPVPHCPIPFGHPCFRGYTPAEHTDIRETWNRHAPYQTGDDYDRVLAEDHLSAIGGFKS